MESAAKSRKPASARSRSKSPAPSGKKTSSRAKSPAPKTENVDKQSTKLKRTPTRKVKPTTAAVANGDIMSPEERKASDQRAMISLLLGIIVPWIVFPLFGVSTKGFVESFHFGQPWIGKDFTYLLALITVLSTPHVFYAWTWTHSKQWTEWCHSRALEPYKAFAMSAHFIKGFQFLAMFLWARVYITNPIAQVTSMHPLKGVLILQLFGIGQLLNVQVYQKIGEAGVYYGTRLGVDVPWVYGFPFSVVPHPQYFGATLSFWASFLLMQNEATVQNGLYLLCVAMAVFYAISSWVEANL